MMSEGLNRDACRNSWNQLEPPPPMLVYIFCYLSTHIYMRLRIRTYSNVRYFQTNW